MSEQPKVKQPTPDAEARARLIAELRDHADECNVRYSDWAKTMRQAADLLAAEGWRDAAIEELRRVAAMSRDADRGGQHVGPMFPGRMPPSMAKHFQKLFPGGTR